VAAALEQTADIYQGKLLFLFFTFHVYRLLNNPAMKNGRNEPSEWKCSCNKVRINDPSQRRAQEWSGKIKGKWAETEFAGWNAVVE